MRRYPIHKAAELADRAGTTRQWVIRLEQGQNSPAMSTVLVALSVLGLEMVALHDERDLDQAVG